MTPRDAEDAFVETEPAREDTTELLQLTTEDPLENLGIPAEFRRWDGVGGLLLPLLLPLPTLPVP